MGKTDHPVRCNLIKAHKYLEKLKNSVKNSKKPKHSWDTTSATPKPIDPNSYVIGIANFHASFASADNSSAHHLAELSKRRIAEFDDFIDVMKDIKSFKTTIYDANSREGISVVLSDLDVLNEEKRIYTAFRDRFGSSDVTRSDGFPEVYHKYAARMTNDTAQNPYASVNVALFRSLQEIDEKIQLLNRKITEQEDVRDRLNANTEIEFEFSQASMRVLGL